LTDTFLAQHPNPSQNRQRFRLLSLPLGVMTVMTATAHKEGYGIFFHRLTDHRNVARRPRLRAHPRLLPPRCRTALTLIAKPLSRISLGDLQAFAQTLVVSGLAPISRARTIAAVKSLFGFSCRMRYLPSNPAAELALPRYEKRLAELSLAIIVAR
jgi:site-specific recombinase XerC